LTSRVGGPRGPAMEPISFGKSCKRCNVYFVTQDRTEEICPWCLRVQEGRGEGAAELVDD